MCVYMNIGGYPNSYSVYYKSPDPLSRRNFLRTPRSRTTGRPWQRPADASRLLSAPAVGATRGVEVPVPRMAN